MIDQSLPEFGLLSDLLRENAARHPERTALVDPDGARLWGDLDRRVDRIASALQREGVGHGQVAAVCARTSIAYVEAFFGTLRAGAAIAPLAPSSTAESLADMLEDCGARVLFLDAETARALEPVKERITAQRVTLDGSSAGRPLEAWMAPEGAKPEPVEIAPSDPFNIIYSSGTTGKPKGIVQPHIMRWGHVARHKDSGVSPDATALVSTPLYSNTTLVVFLPMMAGGGKAVLMPKFDAGRFLELAEQHRVTHAMLVPVQYQRIMAHPEFDRFDLSSFLVKFCTSAPFPAALKADVLKRWPGALVEYYGMTEGGGTCILIANEHPDKLHTVGRPAPGHDIRVIDEQGRELPAGEVGEIVGRSGLMMNGYWNQPGKTSEAEWRDAEGRRYIRTGDVGRFDEDGFLTLMDRRKDMIISGGFNVYPSDLEAVLARNPSVSEAAVIGAPSEQWGETPVAFVVPRPDAEPIDAEALRAWANGQLGKTQRLAQVLVTDSLPRSQIGKVLKRELRDHYIAGR